MGRLGSRRLREIVFLVVGATTPIGILAVNLSAFVMQHLDQFRVGIAVCALISGLALNGVTAWALLSRAERYSPYLFADYRTWLITATAVVIVILSVVGAYLTFQSMKDAHKLPNTFAILSALWLLLLPVLMTFGARWLKAGEERRRAAHELAMRGGKA